MSPNKTRASIAGGLVAVLAAAYFIGGVRSPERVGAAPTQTPQAGAAAVQSNTVSVAGVGRIAGTPDTLRPTVRTLSASWRPFASGGAAAF